MFESLGDRLTEIFSKLRGHGKITEKDVEAAMREIRLALLDADVNYKVVKMFVERVRSRAVGEEVTKSVTPGQQVIKIVDEEMIEILGGGNQALNFSSPPPSNLMLVGLQGSGKTTAAAKLALFLQKQGRNPMLVAADIYRPAAIDQLVALGEKINIPVAHYKNKSAVEIVMESQKEASRTGADVLILDTAGRLHIDEAMMQELVDIKDRVRPSEILLVVDAMTGQDAVGVAVSFLERLDFTGILMTKMDGDARGGAALSMKTMTGRPIKLVSAGEKMEDLEPFYPDRIASRILGMGDVVTLVEKAEQTITEERAKKLEEKLRKQQFDFDDFLEEMHQLEKMGGAMKVLEMVPGMSKLTRDMSLDVDEKRMKRIEAIVQSMTRQERKNPQILNASRRRRIANGSGTSTQEVNQLVKQFAQMQKIMKQFSGRGSGMRGMKKLFPF